MLIPDVLRGVLQALTGCTLEGEAGAAQRAEDHVIVVHRSVATLSALMVVRSPVLCAVNVSTKVALEW